MPAWRDELKTFGYQWHLTDRCNRRCLHCYQDNFERGEELDAEELKEAANRIFQALADRQVDVNLTGGEPLLLPSLEGLCAHLNTFTNLGDVYVITNGTKKIDTLVRLSAGKKITGVKLSMESGLPEVNDRIRGEGNFEEVAGSIEKLRRAGVGVTLMMTLARYNIESIEETVRFARNRGADGIILERFVPIGNGAALANEVLDEGDWTRAKAAILRASDDDADPQDMDPFRAFWIDTKGGREALRGALCNLGDESMALMPDGTVYPCRRLPIPLGNIFEGPFEAILEKLETLARDKKGEDDGDLCSSCAALNHARQIRNLA